MARQALDSRVFKADLRQAHVAQPIVAHKAHSSEAVPTAAALRRAVTLHRAAVIAAQHAVAVAVMAAVHAVVAIAAEVVIVAAHAAADVS